MSYITLSDYFGPWDAEATDEHYAQADILLERVNALLTEAEAHGVEVNTNPVTKTCISGEQYGGFRPQSCGIGAPNSAHKQGRAVDVYDKGDLLDAWITDSWLEEFGLYRESPLSTRGWTHLTDRAPVSGRRTFNP